MGIVIGIRELRQHASRYLRRVRAGETITLTDRGEPFAEIRPVSPHEGVLSRLIAAGEARPATADFATFIERYPPQPSAPGEPSLSDEVIRAREDERY